MRAVQQVIKWSFYTTLFSAILLLGAVFAFWLSIETLSLLMEFSH